MSKRAEATAAVQDAQALAEARVGTALDAKWVLDSLLGRGGMATVYGATHKTTRARAAVKVLHREFAQDEDVSQRFLREARIANSIQHPSKVGVLDEGMSDEGEIFLVMELLQGTTLDAHMKGMGRSSSVEQRLRIFDPILELLGECHAAGIIHRDIKPANIFMTDAGRVKVLDFGIARLRETQTSIDPTRQGTVLGTPAYMAPEQALGLSELVDGRADLWSVGACIYAVLSGQRVHRARSENESMVLAATKSAESIALLMPDLPVEVVAFVDKSLAHDRSNRFPDAYAMRAELNTLIAALRTGQVTAVKAPSRGDAVVVRSQVVVDAELESSTELRAAALERLRSIWKHIGVHLTAVQQYGATHNAALQPLRLAHEEIGQALAERPDAVIWDVSPYAFTFAKTPLWDQDRPQLERAAYKLFSFGLRKVQLRAGLTEDALRRLLAILLGDPAAGYRLAEDPVAELWAERFEHVAHLAIDSFAVGNADDLEAFEAEAAEIAREASDLAVVTKGRDDHMLDSLEARAMQANLLRGLSLAANVAAQIAVDVPTRAALGAQLVMPEERWMERFVDAVGVGLATSPASPAAVALQASLGDWAADRVASGQAPETFELLATLGGALASATTPKEASTIEYALSRRMFDPARFDELLRKAAGHDALDPRVIAGVERLLSVSLDDAYYEAATARFAASIDPRILSALRTYIAKWVVGREAELGRALESAEAGTALQMLELLGSLPEAAATSAAIACAFKNGAAEVRLAALSKVRGELVQQELVALVTDAAQQVRVEVLRVIGQAKLRGVGPTLVRRIQQESFSAYDEHERKAWLSCLHQLNPVRAEELAVAMLTNAPMIRDEKNERTRVIAAEVLAGAESAEALAAVKKASRAVWWNSPAVREAAEKAASAISARRDGKGMTE